jgi:uncharacterized protein with PIN domain
LAAALMVIDSSVLVAILLGEDEPLLFKGEDLSRTDLQAAGSS